MAYVEVKAKTVEMAIEAAMRELGVTERERLEIEVLQEPERGFLGFGGNDAVVKVSERPKSRQGGRGRKRSRKKKGGEGDQPSPKSDRSGGDRGNQRAEAQGGGQQGRKPKNSSGNSPQRQGSRPPKSGGRQKEDDRDALDPTQQEPLVRQFLEGLLGAFGLEGCVETHMDDDVVVANVVGDQTEALVGPRGSVMEAIHELTKTVLQRSVQQPSRVRIDIAGYAARRREALTIYAGDLIGQVVDEGGELMLEPMSAADRKVIHDAVAAHDGVRSYSEGEAPSRYVVLAATQPQAVSEDSPEDQGSEEEDDSPS